jgi:UDP-glucose 4-epimerase
MLASGTSQLERQLHERPGHRRRRLHRLTHRARIHAPPAMRVVVLDTMELGNRAALLERRAGRGQHPRPRPWSPTCAVRNGVEQVVHFAAYKNVGESMEQPARYWLNNVAGTVDLVEALLAAGVKSIVFSSSAPSTARPAVVPVTRTRTDLARERVRRDQGNGRAHPRLVRRHVGAAGGQPALLQRRRCQRRRCHRRGLGAFAEPDPLVMKATLGQAARRCGCSATTTPHPTARASATTSMSTTSPTRTSVRSTTCRRRRHGLALNVGTGVGSSVLDSHRTPPSGISGQEGAVRGRPRRAGDPVSTYADPTKAHEVLGWEATRGLDEIIASAWRWHSDSPRRLRRPTPEQPVGPAGKCVQSASSVRWRSSQPEQHGDCPRVVTQR